MRNHKLAIAAVLSLLLLAVLIASHFFNAGIAYVHIDTSRAIAVDYRTSISISGGNLWAIRAKADVGVLPSASDTGHLGCFFVWAQPYPADWRIIRATWHLAERSTLSMPVGSKPVERVFYGGPAWMLMPPYAIAPLLWLRRWRKQRRYSKPGHCRTCGYDVRATPQGGGDLLPRCPECGAVPSGSNVR